MTSPPPPLTIRAILLVATIFSTSTFASYCGQAAIPFSFQALTNGQPVLGCARPSCFGWRSDGTRAADSAQFFKIFKRPDGFLRKTDIKNRAAVLEDSSAFVAQHAKCEQAYNSTECDLTNQWVGGIGPSTNVSDEQIKLQCCTYTKLQEFSTERGEAEVRPGQIVIGGEVTHEGRQFGFDYIANIRREIDESGKIVYTVAMKRFPCLPEPTKNMKMESVDNQVRDYLLDNIGGKPKKPFDQQKFDLPDQMTSERVRKLGDLALPTNVAPKDVDPEQVHVGQGVVRQQGITQIRVEPAQMPLISDSAVLSNVNSRVPTARVYDNDAANLNVQKIETKNVNEENNFNNRFNNNGFNNGYNGFNNGQNSQGFNNQNYNNGFNSNFNNQNQGFQNNNNNNNNNGGYGGYGNNNQNNNGFNMFTSMPMFPVHQQMFPTLPPATFNSNVNNGGGFSPLPQIRIPSPEDVLPPAGRSLINNMARTFLGLKAFQK